MHELQFQAGGLVRIPKSITPCGKTIWTVPYLVIEVKTHGLMVLDDSLNRQFMPFRLGVSGPVPYNTDKTWEV